MKFTSLTKRMVILTAMIALLLIGAGVHTCGKTNIPEAKASKGSGSTYSSGIIANEKCIVAGFNKRRKKGFAYCCDHKCCIHDCPSQRLSTDIYCQSHHDAFKKNRNGYNGGDYNRKQRQKKKNWVHPSEELYCQSSWIKRTFMECTIKQRNLGASRMT